MNPDIIPPNNNSGHLVKVEDLPRSAISSIIRKLNERSIRVVQSFNKNYLVELHEIKNLIEKISQEFQDIDSISEGLSISIHLSSNQRFDFSSWEDFDQFDKTKKEKTKSISFEYTRDILNKSEQLERYKVQLSIQNLHNRPGFYFGPIALTRIEDAGIPPVTIHTAVEYKNYIRGKNLISTIEEWVASLNTSKNPIIDYCERYADKLAATLAVCAIIGTAFGRLGFIPTEQMTNRELSQFITYSTIMIIMSFFIASLIRNTISDAPKKFKKQNTLNITKGDENYNLSVKNGNAKTLRVISIYTVGLIVQTICGIWTNAIWDFIK